MLSRFLFLLIISCSLGFAHSLKVFAKASDNALEIKGYYYGGSACKGCDVELRDEKGVFVRSKLDDEGRASVELPNIASFKIAVIAAGGHMKESEFSNPNFLQNSQNTKNLQNSSGKQATLSPQNSQNSQNSLEDENSVFLEFLKGFGAILVIFGIFGIIYFVKKKR